MKCFIEHHLQSGSAERYRKFIDIMTDLAVGQIRKLLLKSQGCLHT